MKKIILLCAAAVVVLAVFLAPQFAGAEASTEAKKAFGDAKINLLDKKYNPGDFTLPLLDGGERSLSGYRGKVVILNFWATWCPPCRAEMPSMENLYKRLHGQGLEILAVDLREDKASVQQFIADGHYTFPVLLDEGGKLGSKFGVTAIPASFILDRDGMIIAKIVGSINWYDPKLVLAFETLLKSN